MAGKIANFALVDTDRDAMDMNRVAQAILEQTALLMSWQPNVMIWATGKQGREHGLYGKIPALAEKHGIAPIVFAQAFARINLFDSTRSRFAASKKIAAKIELLILSALYEGRPIKPGDLRKIVSGEIESRGDLYPKIYDELQRKPAAAMQRADYKEALNALLKRGDIVGIKKDPSIVTGRKSAFQITDNGVARLDRTIETQTAVSSDTTFDLDTFDPFAAPAAIPPADDDDADDDANASGDDTGDDDADDDDADDDANASGDDTGADS